MNQQKLQVTSSQFKHGQAIPAQYTCDGDDINPPLEISGIPERAMSLALIMDDPDAPGKTFDHWIVWNIKPEPHIKAGMTPGDVGKNSLGENRYTGPCPPSGTHRYFFKVCALDTRFELGIETDKDALEAAMNGHILASGELMGTYERKQVKQ